MISSRLVLIGGGHSHIQVVKSILMRPMPTVEVYLISDQTRSPYSGMLPGRLAGWYTDSEMHFDLVKMCGKAGVTFIPAAVNGILPSEKKILFEDRAPLYFDLVSLNVGIKPDIPSGFSDAPDVLPLKPISRLLAQWDQWEKRSGLRSVAVVGSGPAGFEVAVGLRLRNPSMQITIVDPHPSPLSGHNSSVQNSAARKLHDLKIRYLPARAVDFQNGHLQFENSAIEKFDGVLLATSARAPSWLRHTGFAVSESGFLEVNKFLQSTSHEFVFAAGDCVRFIERDLPKSGVYAVREGPALARNLRRALERRSLRRFCPQRKTLALLNSGLRRALLSYGPLSLEAKWVWRWKDHIDRKFMRRFDPDTWKSMATMEPKGNTCGGCGGKVDGAIVRAAVSQLPWSPEDASLLENDLWTSIDGFRTFSGDLNFFGRVATWHSLNDIFAMGAKAISANVMVQLKPKSRALRTDDLAQLMAGVLFVFQAADCKMGNGHTAESMETAVTISAVGRPISSLWKKSSAQLGDRLVMTKAIGSGALLQAMMKGQLRAEDFDGLRTHLLLGHWPVVRDLQGLGISAATDISGFGLVGHLSEIAVASQARLDVALDKVTVLPGAIAAIGDGNVSELLKENQRSYRDSYTGAAPAIFFDPQTHGPLVFAVPAAHVRQVLERLSRHGFNGSEIGEVAATGVAPGLNFR